MDFDGFNLIAKFTFKLFALGMGRLSVGLSAVATLLLVGELLFLAHGQSLSIVSSSAVVGDTSVNYTFVVSNASATTSAVFNFGSWSALTAAPFASLTKCYLAGSALSCISFPTNQISCTVSISGSFNLTLSLMTNPSSTKPYPINLTLANPNTSRTLSSTLTVSSLASFPITFQGYSRVLGATSSTVSGDIIMNNYIDATTFLSLTYNPSLITLTIPNTTAYTVLQNTNGTAIISNWNNLSSLGGKVTLTGMSISNPQAAISFTISGLVYFKSGNVTYNVQTISSTISLSPAAFSTFTLASPLYYGVLSSLAITSACSFTQVSSGNASNPAYTTVDFTSELQPTASSTCVATNVSTTCKHTSSGTYTLTNFQAGIGSFTSTSLTFTSYTFYAGAYYPLCRSTPTISFALQPISPYVLTSECDTVISSLANTINIYTTAQSAAAGDLLYIYGLKGVISTPWAQANVSNNTWYAFTLASSHVVPNGTTKLITAPITYNNPNETVSNSILQIGLYRNGTQYASMTNSSVTVCSITAGRPIASSSVVPSSYNTYDKVNISVDFTLGIFDYAWNDYMTLQIGSTGLGKQYFLAGSLLGLVPNLTVNGAYCSFTATNDYTLRIVLDRNVTLPSAGSPVLTINLMNLMNPPIVDSYWFALTTVDQPTGGTKEVLTATITTALKAAPLTFTIGDVYELANNSVSLVVGNPNRLILSKNNGSASTTLTATLPSTLSCSGFPNGSISTTWSVGVLTSTASASGNTTTLTINLGTCFVLYFANSTSFTLSQTFSSTQSTSTAVSARNKCGSCYQCSNGSCSACFNSTYTTAIYYYSNQCFTACPSNTYTLNSACFNCHSSCLTCVGPLYSNCTSCSSSFTLTGTYCGSVCGAGKYQFNGSCANCHPNCESCLSSTVCYVCKSSAVMIGTECQFSSCTSPCQSCFGALTSCLTCISGYYLYQSQCYSPCPSGTYQTGSTCTAVSESTTYVPVTITGIVCFGLLVLLRVYSSKKIGNETRRRKTYEEGERQVNYKINLLRVASVLFSYLELAAAVVILLKDGSYSVGSKAAAAVLVGLIMHFLGNMVFLVGYLRMACLKRVENEGGEQEEAQESSARLKLIVILSAVFSFRTYKLLEANLFLDRNTLDRPREGIPSRKLIRSNSLGDENQEVVAPVAETKTGLPKEGRFVHPFLTYLTLADLVLGTLVVLVGAILQVLGALFPQMLLWGVDCLLVGICSLGLTGWDLWVFANLHHSEQHSEMSSRQDANNTHENLKHLTDFDIKIEPDRPPDSPKKQTERGGKASQRTQKAKPKEKEELSMEGVRGGIKRECDEVETVARDQALPRLKVFEDFDEQDENVLNEKKTKKFSTKNLRRGDKKLSSQRMNPVSYRRNAVGEVCDDLYINFAAEQHTHVPTHLPSRRSASPNRSLQESIEVGGDFEEHEQPPNFADISDIEPAHPEPINISLSSEPHPPSAHRSFSKPPRYENRQPQEEIEQGEQRD